MTELYTFILIVVVGAGVSVGEATSFKDEAFVREKGHWCEGIQSGYIQKYGVRGLSLYRGKCGSSTVCREENSMDIKNQEIKTPHRVSERFFQRNYEAF